MRRKLVLGVGVFLAAFVSLAASAPVIYAVSARDVPNRTTQVSIVLSTIDSNGTVTDLGPIIPVFKKRQYALTPVFSGLCPRGLIYNFAVNFVGNEQAVVYFYSIQHQKVWRQVNIPSVLPANNAPLAGMYFDAQTLFALYGNTLIYVDPESGNINRTVEVWPASLNCEPSHRLHYDLQRKVLLAYCSTQQGSSISNYLIYIDPATGSSVVPPALQTTDNKIQYFVSYTNNNSLIIETTPNGPLVRTVYQARGSWGDIIFNPGRFSPDPATWLGADATAWDGKTGTFWFEAKTPNHGRGLVSANVFANKMTRPVPLSMIAPFTNWEFVLPFTK